MGYHRNPCLRTVQDEWEKRRGRRRRRRNPTQIHVVAGGGCRGNIFFGGAALACERAAWMCDACLWISLPVRASDVPATTAQTSDAQGSKIAEEKSNHLEIWVVWHRQRAFRTSEHSPSLSHDMVLGQTRVVSQ